MKILFLDIDGVLNSSDYRIHRYVGKSDGMTWDQAQIDPEAILLLNKIIQATGCYVVVSSAWRTLHSRLELQEILNARGFLGRIIGVTPDLSNKTRGDEIQAWLDNHAKRREPVKAFAILDDLDEGHVSIGHLAAKLIQTSLEKGLTDYEANRVITLMESS